MCCNRFMDTQKTLHIRKPAVMADFREKEVIDQLKSLGVVVNELSLEVGDFVCSENKIVIERKSHSDFVSSIIDGRLFEQSRIMKENFEIPIVIVEGFSNREMNDNAFKAALASLIVDYGVTILNTSSPADTAKIIYWIVEKEQTENKMQLSFKVGKKPKDEKIRQEFVLSSFPGVSVKTARKLLENFGTIKNVLSANKIELEKVVGKSTTDKIFGLVNRKYKNL